MSTESRYQPKSFHLQWHITERCNLKCKHCYFDEKFLKNELSLNKLFVVLDDYINLLKKWKLPREASRISITGGEPLIRNDFFEFLEKCYQNRKKLGMGSLLMAYCLTMRK